MAATLFSKARLVALSVAHSLLDQAIDMNSVEAVRQNVRDLETAADELGKSLATHRGLRRGLERDLGALQAQRDDLNGQIDDLLPPNDSDPSNDPYATTLEADLMGVEPLLADKEEEYRDMEKTISTMAQTLSMMQAKLTTMRGQLSRLQSQEHAAGAKESAAAAMQQAKSSMETGVDASVDSVAARIQKRYDIADELLESAASGFADTTKSDAAMATVAARLAKRQAANMAKKSPAAPVAG